MFANDHCTGKLNYVKLIRESIWFAMIDSRIDSVRNILIRCTPMPNMKRIRLMAAKLSSKENADPAESLLPYTNKHPS